MSNEGFDFSKFVNDSKTALLKPKEYFESMPVSGGIGEPVIKALIYGTIAGIFTLIWGLLHIGGITGGMFGGMIGGAIGIMGLIWSIVGALIGLFIGGVILLVFSAICGGNTDYEANVRVTASLMVISPIKAFFGFFGFLSFLGSLVGLIISLYAIWMLFHALNGSLKSKPASSKVLSIVLAALLALFFLIGLGTKKAVKNYSNKYNDVFEEMSKSSSEVGKALEKVTKDISKDMGKASKNITGSSEVVVTSMEKPDGTITKNPDQAIVITALGELDENNNHLIFNMGDAFIQTAVTDNGFTIEYRDDSGYFRTKSDVQLPMVISAFTSYMQKNPMWKNMFEWKPAE